METEDWWVLVEGEGAAPRIEHSWSYLDPSGESLPNSGAKQYSVEEFLKGEHDRDAQIALRKIVEGYEC
jgi:hypothetical protein